MDLLREMMGVFKAETNIDIVFVIDLSLGMEPMLSLVRNTPWGEIIKKLCLSQGREIGTLRFKVMWYADSKCCNDSCFGESKFYLMPHEEHDFYYFLNNLHIISDGEKTPGLEALERALDSDWNQDGDRLRHIIILFTDKEAYQKRVTHTMDLEYIGGKWDDEHQSEETLCTFLEKWSRDDSKYGFKGNGKLSVPGRRLVLFAPGTYPWINLEYETEHVIRYDVALGQGGREISGEDIQSIFYFN